MEFSPPLLRACATIHSGASADTAQSQTTPFSVWNVFVCPSGMTSSIFMFWNLPSKWSTSSNPCFMWSIWWAVNAWPSSRSKSSRLLLPKSLSTWPGRNTETKTRGQKNELRRQKENKSEIGARSSHTTFYKNTNGPDLPGSFMVFLMPCPPKL